VTANGTPISSALAYLLPIDPSSSYMTSKLLDSSDAMRLATSSSPSLDTKGNTATCTGATRGGSERITLPSLIPYAHDREATIKRSMP
jgi:hypothetical protein